MSADNWTTCPRCKARIDKANEEALKSIKAKLVSIDESAEPFNEPDTQPIHDLIDETLAALETVQTP